MFLVRYFIYVGGVLLGLLFISDAYLPKLPMTHSADASFSIIRIHSARKLPQRIVFDTSAPTFTAVQTARAGLPAAAPATAADLSAKAHVRDAYAQLQPSDRQLRQPDQKQAQLTIPRKSQPKPPRKRKIARKPGAPMILVAQQPQFGLFGRDTW
jgi:hypothetical protein